MKHVLIFALSIAAVLAADPKPAEKMTKAGHTAAVSKYTVEAEKFAAKAARHEAAALRIAEGKTGNAMVHKWPAMGRNILDKERSLAAEARRNESEARDLVAFHQNLAEKTGFEAEP